MAGQMSFDLQKRQIHYRFMITQLLSMKFSATSSNLLQKCIALLLFGVLCSANGAAQKKWSLQECIDYALTNNIQLKQNMISAASAEEDELAAKAALLPGVSANTNQNVSYRPFSQQTINLTNGTMTTSKSETSYNGSYGISANWTVWNGGRNTRNIKRSRYSRQLADLQTQETANSIQEQITQLYIQILYENEAVKVDSEIVKASILQRDRAKERVKLGDLAKVDLAQLEAQVTQDQYQLVSAQSQLDNYKLQLKQLLELQGTEDFDVEMPLVSDGSVMTVIPPKTEIYNTALTLRPEIASGKMNVEASNLDVMIARSGYYPTISMNAGLNTSNASAIHTNFATQAKTNWNNAIGLTISMPIFDNRQTKTAVQKAKLSVENSQLQLQSTQKKLYSDIENYWLQATTAQQQYLAARANVESMQQSYDLVSEQFRLRMKNIVELTTGKNNLLQAQQNLLQSKYTALYNLAMLRFFQGQGIRL